MALIILVKEESGTVHRKPLIEGNALMIGRSRDCDIKITDDVCSGKHCSITLKKNTIVLKDLDSTNGTFLGSKRISKAYMKVEHEFMIGSTIISLDLDQISSDERMALSLALSKGSKYRSITMYGINETDKDKDLSLDFGNQNNKKSIISSFISKRKK